MVDDVIRKTPRKTWHKWSLYMYIILFFITGLLLYFLVKDVMLATEDGGSKWLLVTRDVAFIAIAQALIFVISIRNLFIIMRRSL